jgi:hypothetical protein
LTEEHAGKIFLGDTIDVNITPDQLEFKSQAEISKTWVKMRTKEFVNRKIFWFFIALTVISVFATVFIDSAFIFLLAISFYLMIKRHLEYLKAWSARMKYDKRIYTRMDPQ